MKSSHQHYKTPIQTKKNWTILPIHICKELFGAGAHQVMAVSSVCTKGPTAGNERIVSFDNRTTGNNLWLQLAKQKAILSITEYCHLLTVFCPLCSTVQEPYQGNFCRTGRFGTSWLATHGSKSQLLVDDLSISKALQSGKPPSLVTSHPGDKFFTLCMLKMLAMGKILPWEYSCLQKSPNWPATGQKATEQSFKAYSSKHSPFCIKYQY